MEEPIISNGTLYLSHYQRKGAKWGERNYQSYMVTPIPKRGIGIERGEAAAQSNRLSDKSSEKPKGLIDAVKSIGAKRKEKKERAAKIKAQKQRAELAKDFAKNKDDIINSGDPDRISKYAGLYSDNEMHAAIRSVQQKRAINEQTFDKGAILRSGNAKKVLKYADQFNANELNEAINVINNRAKLKSFSEPKQYDALATVKRMNDWMDTSVKMAENAIKGYNQYVRFSNTFFNSNLKPIPSGNDKQKKKKTEDDDE